MQPSAFLIPFAMAYSSGGRLAGRAGWWLHIPPEECAISLFPHDSGHHPAVSGARRVSALL
jgi:hypothetical protein